MLSGERPPTSRLKGEKMNDLTRQFSELSKGVKILIIIGIIYVIGGVGSLFILGATHTTKDKAAPVTTATTTASAADKEAKKAELEAKKQAKEEEKQAKEEERARKEAERKAEEERKQFEKDNDDDHINAMARNTAYSLCKQQTKQRSNFGDSLEFDPYNSDLVHKDRQLGHDEDRWVIDSHVSEENAFGVRSESVLRCYITPSAKDEGVVTVLVGDEVFQDQQDQADALVQHMEQQHQQ